MDSGFFDSEKETSFDIPEPEGRRLPKISLIPCIIKLFLSFGLVTSIIVGYALAFKVVHFGPVSIGFYGIILFADFLMQFTCATLNRRSVNRIAALASGEMGNVANEKALDSSGEPRADISIAVVGYREDEESWRKCLRSLQTQTLRPRSVIAVVDGNAPEDMVMANAFDAEFAGPNAKVIHLPVLLSRIYGETYREALQASGEPTPTLFTRIWRWLRNVTTPAQFNAQKKARNRVIEEVRSWERTYSITDYSAVCFTQPHGHKRVSSLTPRSQSVRFTSHP
jgi:hyaluronan synthase